MRFVIVKTTMRLSRLSGSLLAVGAFVLLATSSRAGDEQLVTVSCSAGELTATAKAPWHPNAKAPWKWDKGDKVAIDERAARFKGKKCEGTVKAFVCNADQCRGPIVIPVKPS
jgi:hypothetical protein